MDIAILNRTNRVLAVDSGHNKGEGVTIQVQGFQEWALLDAVPIAVQSFGEGLFLCLKLHGLTLCLFLCRKEEALVLWNERSTPMSVMNKAFFLPLSDLICSTTPIVKSIDFGLSKFQSLSLEDLDRLKDHNRWLLDSHLILTLLWVFFLSFLSLSE